VSNIMQPSGASIRRREFLTRFLGNSLLAAGGSLFGAAAAYQIYSQRASVGLSDLKRGSPLAAPVATAALAAATSTATTQPAQDQPKPDQTAPASAPSVAETPAAADTPAAEPASFAAATPVQAATNVPPGLLPVKLRIQSIGLADARVVEVGTRIEKGQLVWETADHAVGHHSGTGLPGQPGNIVMSGHISSPVRGEGNVFRSLPNLKDKLGSRASIQTADGTWYHYDITGTDVVLPADTWVLDATPSPLLTLITCVPDGVYTHRFVARGQLAGRS